MRHSSLLGSPAEIMFSLSGPPRASPVYSVVSNRTSFTFFLSGPPRASPEHSVEPRFQKLMTVLNRPSGGVIRHQKCGGLAHMRVVARRPPQTKPVLAARPSQIGFLDCLHRNVAAQCEQFAICLEVGNRSFWGCGQLRGPRGPCRWGEGLAPTLKGPWGPRVSPDPKITNFRRLKYYNF